MLLTTLEIHDKAKEIDSLPDEVLEKTAVCSDLLEEISSLEEERDELAADNERLTEALWSHFSYMLDEIPTERENLDIDDFREITDFLEKTLTELYQQYAA